MLHPLLMAALAYNAALAGPIAPQGFVFLVAKDGAFLRAQDGAYLVVRA